MGKKRFTQYPYKKSLNKFDFDKLTGISGTLDDQDVLHNESASGSFRPPEGYSIPVRPVFKEEKNGGGFVKWSQLSLSYKIAAGVCAFLITVVVPVVWWASKIDIGVSDLKNDVKEIKTKIEKLTESTITNSSKIDTLDKFGKNKR